MRTLRRWWWIPLVALIGIFLKALLLTPWVAGKAEDAALTALGSEGLGAVEFVEVDGVDGWGGDGLNVVLTGPASDRAAAIAVVEARDEVKTVTYRALDGNGDGDGDDGAAAATGTGAGTEGAAETDGETDVDTDAGADVDEAAGAEQGQAAPSLAPMDLDISAADGAIVLRGSVADDATRAAVVAEAEARYGSENVTDELTVDAATAAEGGLLRLTGEAASEVERTAWLAAGGAVAAAAGLEVADELTVRPVEQQLNDLFALEPIEFDVSRATIRPQSIATLDAAAAVINDNPEAGRLLVVGHTDGDGSDSANQALSEARAAAVVAYLVADGEVDPGRLDAEGRGEAELLVSPEVTPEDKQRNRRIEWELIS